MAHLVSKFTGQRSTTQLLASRETTTNQAKRNFSQVIPTLAKPRQVQDAQLTSDSQHVVYLANQRDENIFELFCISIDGGKPSCLTPGMTPGGNVTQFQVSTDGQFAVYLADRNINNVYELFSVSLVDGETKRLNASLVKGGNVIQFQISPDSQRVVYRANQSSKDTIELFSVVINNRLVSRLNAPMGDMENVFDFVVGANDTVLYRVRSLKGRQSLFGVPITGGNVEQLNPSLSSSESVSDLYQVSHKQNIAVYGIRDAFGTKRILASPRLAGFNLELMTRLLGAVNIFNFSVSSDGNYLVYQADQNLDGSATLLSMQINENSFVAQLSSSLPCREGVRNFRITPDSRHVVYSADYNIDGVAQLFIIPIAGGRSEPLSHQANETVDVTFFKLSHNGEHVIYEAKSITDSSLQLFQTPITGGPTVSLSDGIINYDHGEFSFETSQNGELALYITPNRRQVFTARIAKC